MDNWVMFIFVFVFAVVKVCIFETKWNKISSFTDLKNCFFYYKIFSSIYVM